MSRYQLLVRRETTELHLVEVEADSFGAAVDRLVDEAMELNESTLESSDWTQSIDSITDLDEMADWVGDCLPKT